MRTVLLAISTLVLSCISVSAQVHHQEKFFWWGASPKAVIDSIHSQGYWREASIGQSKHTDEHFETFYTLDQTTVLVYSFYYEMLIKTVWRTDEGTVFYRLFEGLIENAVRISEDKWYHPDSKTIITKTHEESGTFLYARAPDLADATLKKLEMSK